MKTNIPSVEIKHLVMAEPELSSSLRPHRRQFIVGSTPCRPYEDWRCYALDHTTWISYCPDLRVASTQDTDGVTWMLIGLAVETLEQRKADSLEQIAQSSSAQVPALYPSWTGRWMLIGNGDIHLDASGSLGCFYGTDDSGHWMSSSPALLAHLLEAEIPLLKDTQELHYCAKISWFTPPHSRFAAIKRLLPSQILQLKDGTVRSRPILPTIDPAIDYDTALKLLKDSMITALQRLSKSGEKLWLGLSAGFDSRLVLAMAQAAEIDLMPFTRLTGRMSVADQLLPPQLARSCGYDHTFIRGGKRQSDRLWYVEAHSAGHVSEGDAEPFLQGVRDTLEGIALGGQGFGVGKVLARNFPATVGEPETTARLIAAVARQKPRRSGAVAGLQSWLDWVLQTPHPGLDWRDRFYIEQRLAGWQSSKEQLYDLTGPERFFIINSAWSYALLLSIEAERRVGCLHHVDLIRRTAPQLLEYPLNPRDRHFGIFRAIFAKARYPGYLYQKVAGKLLWAWQTVVS